MGSLTLPVGWLAFLAVPAAQEPPTFAQDIAPLIHQRCSACHHPGEAAPFSLLTYGDVAKRSRQIVRVTEGGFMPPWLPEGGHVSFLGNRSLSEDELELLRRWHEAGAPEGDPERTPAPPSFPEGWILGEPDLVLEMPVAYSLMAEGRDVYRNFVLPGPHVEGTRFVRAVEFRPDNRRVLHHCALYVDGTGAARAEDAADREPGYPSMDAGATRIPDGQFLGWVPGKAPQPGRDEVAWRLDPHTDLVLQCHMRPSGKREDLRIKIGLHFAERPPTIHPLAINVWSRELRIPPGEPAYRVQAEYETPVDLQVLGVAPHAHYLGDDLHGYAVLPDGTRKTLVRIPDWDFNWQEEYLYAEPVFVPRGSILAIDYTFDNSEDNPQNPNIPPKRVVYGPQSSNEMAELLLQVLPSDADRPLLFHDYLEYSVDRNIAYFDSLAELTPGRPRWLHMVGSYCLKNGRTARAVEQYEELVAARPGKAFPLSALGRARLAHGDLEGALASLEASLALAPADPDTLTALGLVFERQGRSAEALTRLRAALAAAPEHGEALVELGRMQRLAGESQVARGFLERALAANPEDVAALTELARLELELGHPARARTSVEGALYIRPDHAQALGVLGLVHEAEGDRDEAERLLSLAVAFESTPSDLGRELERVRGTR